MLFSVGRAVKKIYYWLQIATNFSGQVWYNYVEIKKIKGERTKKMGATKDKKPGYDSEFMGCYLKIKLRGEIDHHSASSIRSAIDSEIYSKKPRGLIMDMSAVNFMDSSGLGLIMGRYSVMNELGGEVIVSDPNPSIERIMTLAGMERVIKISHTREQDITPVPPRVRGRRRSPAGKQGGN